MGSEFEPQAPMPSAIMAEQSVISICLKNLNYLSRAKAEGIDAECFYDPRCKTVWAVIGEYSQEYTDAQEIDVGILIQMLHDGGKLVKAGSQAYIAELWTYAPTEGSYSAWCNILREMKARRMAKVISSKLDQCEDSEEAIETTQAALESLRQTISGKQRSQTGKAAASDFLKKFQADYEAGDIPGMSTGIPELDLVSGGMRSGEFWVIGGKPSMGKSVLMLQIAEAFIARGDAAAVYSLEMMQAEILGRLVTVTGHVSYGSITQPRTASGCDLKKIQSAVKKIAESPLWIDASAGQSIESISTEAEMIRDRHGDLKLVVVDYLQLIRGNRSRGESREEEVARVSGGLKQLAKRLSCPVLSASQLNEEGKTRESRAIEQDADVLLGIFEDGIKIGKLRNGERGYILTH
jgi:replicative DNA helicase